MFEEKYLKQISTAKLKQKRRNDQIITIEDYDQIYIEEELRQRYTWLYRALLVGFVSVLVLVYIDIKKTMDEGDKFMKENQVRRKSKGN